MRENKEQIVKGGSAVGRKGRKVRERKDEEG
jgi:hypothetical protein